MFRSLRIFILPFLFILIFASNKVSSTFENSQANKIEILKENQEEKTSLSQGSSVPREFLKENKLNVIVFRSNLQRVKIKFLKVLLFFYGFENQIESTFNSFFKSKPFISLNRYSLFIAFRKIQI